MKEKGQSNTDEWLKQYIHFIKTVKHRETHLKEREK
jgi:hypothetical protein